MDGHAATIDCVPAPFSSHLTRIPVTTYYVPSYVYYVLEDDAVVFLNLRTDQYSMLLGTESRVFNTLLIPGETSMQRTLHFDHSSSSRDPDKSAAKRTLLSKLLKNNLLSTHESSGVPPTYNEITVPTAHLLDSQPYVAKDIRLTDVHRFFASSMLARWKLKTGSIERIVRSIEQRKRLRAAESTVDFPQVCRLLHIYNSLGRLRPHVYTCLPDSLALLEFLAMYNCYANWVFAVKIEPWAAHCWVQYGTFILNTDIHEARMYLPLMAI